MIISEMVAVVVLLLVILYQGWVNIEQRRYFEHKEKDLLNRLMADNYAQYVQAEVMTNPPKQPMEPYEERGIPV